ncbi:hypothetical protein WH218_14735 [Stenotrophomonas indicatrix]|uniref:hypothetical protein n=1 Tax=Stenotrophomonas indicatrix TaxID=2045451 RepID=UPI0015DF1A62|nr:hypothetical protein [Stenotrophomonas indicatrix]MBA0100305.1 hypothetical protein [Stenotrophomonas indicatrix]
MSTPSGELAMVGLYLLVRTLLPVLLGGLVAMLGARVINARLARLPPRVIALPDDSLLPSPAAQRRYRRMLRRRPRLQRFTQPPKVPRSWVLLAAMAFIGTVGLTVYLMPDGPRFQVLVESTLGYPSTVIEVRAPMQQQLHLLDACAPVLHRTVRPITMRYRRARTGNPVEVHGVLPVQVRHRGTLLQVATAQPVDAAVLRDALHQCSASSNVTLTIQSRAVAPWREWGWQPWPGRNSQ